MCLIFLSFNQHPEYPFIALANRDEFYDRPSGALAPWADYPDIYAGKDLSAGGTWLGITTSGHFAMLTNYRDMSRIKKNAPSRGKLVLDYLIAKTDPANYLQALFASAPLYNGYNIMLGSVLDPWYYSNQNNKIIRLGSGSYGLSNALIDSNWPKVQEGKKAFDAIISKEKFTHEELFQIMMNRQFAEDNQLPDTGIGYDKEKQLSSMFIKMAGYGTRNSTLVIVDKNNYVTVMERTFNQQAKSVSDQSYSFTIKSLT